MAKTNAYISNLQYFQTVLFQWGFIFAKCMHLILQVSREQHKWGNIVTEPVCWPGAWPAGDCLSADWAASPGAGWSTTGWDGYGDAQTCSQLGKLSRFICWVPSFHIESLQS